MRKIPFILLVLLFATESSAQFEKPRNLPSFDYKKLHWGFTVGLNSMDYAIKRAENASVYPDVIGFQPAGFQVNIVSDLRLSDYWNLRFLPGINLGSRNMIYFDPGSWEAINLNDLLDIDPSQDNDPYASTIGSSYLDFPLLLKYRSERINNYRPYVIGGLSYRLDMSAKQSFSPDDDDLIILKRGDVYLEAGFGIDQYLQYFKYSTELKVAMGLRNLMQPGIYKNDNVAYADAIEGVRSFIVMLNFHFE